MAGLRHFLAGALLVSSFAACDGDVLVGEFVPEASQGGTGGSGGVTSTTGAGGVSTTANGGSAGASECIQRSCQNGPPYDCGDCVDNDGDLLVDSDDPDCLGPCHNSESTYYGSIPGQDGGNCEKDCYFDNNSGSGNDECSFDQRCDSNEPNPACAYDPEAESCEDAAALPSQKCLDTCLPLVPNGCDCFGCCEIPGAPTPVFLGSEVDGSPTCDRGSLADPEKCRPCSVSTTCFNSCDPCEVCVGKPDPDPGCGGDGEQPQECPEFSDGCGLTGQSDCGVDYYCITGCCILTIK